MQPNLDPALVLFERDRTGRLVVELARRQILPGRPAMDADSQALTAAMRRKRPVSVDMDEGDRFAVRRRRVKRDVLRLERGAGAAPKTSGIETSPMMRSAAADGDTLMNKIAITTMTRTEAI